MALTATIHRFEITLSDVDRNVYEKLELRLAQHPSETTRYLLTRLFAYALSYEDGIAFSKGGLSDADEPPVAVRDRTGRLLHWIDIGVPSADRLHKASKAAPRVSIFTSADLGLLRKEAKARIIHKVADIEVFHLAPKFLDAIEEKVVRATSLEVTRSDGALYVNVAGVSLETELVAARLDEPS